MAMNCFLVAITFLVTGYFIGAYVHIAWMEYQIRKVIERLSK